MSDSDRDRRTAPLRRNRFQVLFSEAEYAELGRRATLAQVGRAAVIRAAVFGAGADPQEEERRHEQMSATDDEYPDSRDPKPRADLIRQAKADLKRIAREAHRIRGRANDERDGSDIEALATLVAELADVLKATIEER